MLVRLNRELGDSPVNLLSRIPGKPEGCLPAFATLSLTQRLSVDWSICADKLTGLEQVRRDGSGKNREDAPELHRHPPSRF